MGDANLHTAGVNLPDPTMQDYVVHELERILKEEDWPSIRRGLTEALLGVIRAWPDVLYRGKAYEGPEPAPKERLEVEFDRAWGA